MLKRKETSLEIPAERQIDVQRLEQLEPQSKEAQLRQQFQLGNPELNNYVMGDIPLKYVDFSAPEIYKKFRNKRPSGKSQILKHQFEKLKIMFDLAYKSQDFEELKMWALNSDQLLTLLRSENFTKNAKKEKVIEALKGVQKSREIKIFKERAEIMSVVNDLALDHRTLA